MSATKRILTFAMANLEVAGFVTTMGALLA
jgi:hypothetical protein